MSKTKLGLKRIVLVGGEKGGTGKTTTAVNLAGMRVEMGHKTLLLDVDAQHNANDFATIRASMDIQPHIPCMQKLGTGVGRELEQLIQLYDTIVVDAGGRDSVELRSALTKADMLISPLQPSQFDLWTLKKLDQLIMLNSAINPKLEKANILFTQAGTNRFDSDAEDATQMLDDYPQTLFKCPVVTHSRKAYRRSVASGMTVVEYERELNTPPAEAKSSQEMKDLYEFIFGERFNG